jgi:photosystem II stability/assembly factor-like uncharacterized protein
VASCLKNDNEEIVLSDDAAITAFTLGTLYRTVSKSDGTTATTTLTGSVYKMTIDHIGGKVYNQDKLPTGTNVSNVYCTVTAYNSGGIAIQNATDSLFRWYSSSEPIDFTTPRLFRIFSTDGSYYRDYTVTLNVGTGEDNAFAWKVQADTTLLQGFGDMRLASLNDSVLIVVGQKDGKPCLRVSKDYGLTWTRQDSTLIPADAWKSLVVMEATAYLPSNGKLLASTDGAQWEEKGNVPAGLIQMVGAGTKELYALCADSTLKVSDDKGATWKNETMDETLTADSVKHLLAISGIASTFFAYQPCDSADYVLMAGNDGKQTVVWRKITQYGGYTKGGKWVSMTYDKGLYRLPLQQRLSLLSYEGSVLAIGDGTAVYETRDQGITWRVKTSYALPQTVLTAVADRQGNVWAISADGKLWKGAKH